MYVFMFNFFIICSNKEPNGTSPNNHQTHPPDLASKWSTPSEDSKALVQIYQNITKLCLCSTSSFCFSSNPSPPKNRTSSREDSWRVKSLAYKDDQQGQGQGRPGQELLVSAAATATTTTTTAAAAAAATTTTTTTTVASRKVYCK